MQTSYRLNARDPDQNFLESFQALFQDKEIEIVVYDVDETAYLLKSAANQKYLLQAIENAENSTNLVEVNFEDYKRVGGLCLKHLHLKILMSGQGWIKRLIAKSSL